MLPRDDRLVRAAARPHPGPRRGGGVPRRCRPGAAAARADPGRPRGRRARYRLDRGAVRAARADPGGGARGVGARGGGGGGAGAVAMARPAPAGPAGPARLAGGGAARRAGHAGPGRAGRRAGRRAQQRRLAELPPAPDRELGAEPVGRVLPDGDPPAGRQLARRRVPAAAPAAAGRLRAVHQRPAVGRRARLVVLEATSTQTDLVVGCWVTAGASLALAGTGWGQAGWLGLATGLTAATKVNGLAVLAPFLLVWAAARWRQWRTLVLHSAAIGAIAALLAGPFVVRAEREWDNLAGDPVLQTVALGRHDPAAVTVNGVRIAATVLNTTSGTVNAAMVRAVDGLADLLRLPAEDPRLVYGVPRFTSVALPFPDEDHSAYPVQALAVLLATGFALVGRRRPGPVRGYAFAVALAMVLTAALVAWQPWINRLILPTFVVGTPLVGWAGGRLLHRRAVAVVVAAVVVLAGGRAAYAVWAGQPRPLGTANSVLTASREHGRYVRARDREEPYQLAAHHVAASGAARVGLLQTSVAWEYAWWVELRRAGVQPVLVSLDSALPKHPAPRIDTVDAVLCTFAPADCAARAPARWTVFEYPGVSVLLSPDAARRAAARS